MFLVTLVPTASKLCLCWADLPPVCKILHRAPDKNPCQSPRHYQASHQIWGLHQTKLDTITRLGRCCGWCAYVLVWPQVFKKWQPLEYLAIVSIIVFSSRKLYAKVCIAFLLSSYPLCVWRAQPHSNANRQRERREQQTQINTHNWVTSDIPCLYPCSLLSDIITARNSITEINNSLIYFWIIYRPPVHS